MSFACPETPRETCVLGVRVHVRINRSTRKGAGVVQGLGCVPARSRVRREKERARETHQQYMVTSLRRRRTTLGPYSRPIHMALRWWQWCGVRGTRCVKGSGFQVKEAAGMASALALRGFSRIRVQRRAECCGGGVQGAELRVSGVGRCSQRGGRGPPGCRGLGVLLDRLGVPHLVEDLG